MPPASRHLHDPPRSLADTLRARAELTPDAPSVLGPDRPPLTYGRLWIQVRDVVAGLNAFGLGRKTRVAVALPNGPDAAVAMLGVAAGAIAVPLNPAYAPEELDRCLSSMRVEAVVVPAAGDSPARRAAEARGLAILGLSPRPEASGVFALTGPALGPAVLGAAAEPGDIALLMHTSGSTGRPKIVPLTHANLWHGAQAYARGTGLRPDDRCLNLSPLCHYHGLVAVSLASWQAGASVAYPAGYDASRFFEWLERFRPTWYLAVASVHQTILARAEAHRGVIGRSALRFIRAGGAQVPRQVTEDLQRMFGVPVIESYGMTEAGLITLTPLAPRAAKPGSSGVAVDAAVAIMDEHRRLLGPDERGEVAVKGPAVFSGYEGDADENRRAFQDGWFRTGDAGVLDGDGYLFLTGRLKEIIVRAGQKISPREVDEVLLRHLAVAQCLTFPLPDPRLGEDVAAAVVLRAGQSATDRELRGFATERLALFKVPRRIVFVPELQAGPLGKPDRKSMARQLGLVRGDGEPAPRPAFAAPRTELEVGLARLWAETLGVDRVGADDDFFELGGDSLLAATLLLRIKEAMGADMPATALFANPRLAELAEAVLARLVEKVDADEQSRILTELEGLSGDAVRLRLGNDGA